MDGIGDPGELKGITGLVQSLKSASSSNAVGKEEFRHKILINTASSPSHGRWWCATTRMVVDGKLKFELCLIKLKEWRYWKNIIITL